MNSDPKRESLIERCRKLGRMTTERGATENEALAAAAALSRLVSEHSISQSELQVRADAQNCVKDALVSLRNKESGWSKVAINIERLYGTICWLDKKSEDVLGLGFETETTSVVFYGFPLDVAASICTLAIIGTALDTSLEALGRVRRDVRDSFEVGFCDRINERLREMRQQRSDAFRNASKGALVVLKDQLVKDEFAKTGQVLRRSRKDNPVRDQSAYAKGKAAGSAVALDPQVANNQRRRLA